MPTSALRSARSRSRFSNAVSGSSGAAARRRRRRERRQRGRGGRRRRLGEQLQRVAGLGRLQHVVVAAGARPQRAERLAGLAPLAALGDRLALGLEDQRVVALLLDLDRELLQPRVGRQEDVRHLHLGRRRAADEAPDHLAEEELGARGGRVDADAQARDVDALGDHQHRDQPRRRAGREARDPRRGVRRVGVHDVRPLAGDPRQPVGELLRVLLVDRDDQPARVGVIAGADRAQLLVGVAQDVGDPVALRVQRRPQPPRGLRARAARRRSPPAGRARR